MMPGCRLQSVHRLGVLVLLLAAAALGCRGEGAVKLPMPKKIVDLSPTITEDLPIRQLGHRAIDFLGIKDRVTLAPVAPSKDSYAFGLTEVEMPTIVGAHLDAPGRLLKNGERADQVPLDKLYGRARVIDLSWKDRHSPIQITDLENYSIGANEVLLLYVGYSQPQDDDWPTYPPLSVQAAQWLAAKKIQALGTDMPSIGSFNHYMDLMEKNRPPEEIWQEKLAFFKAGIPIVEGLTNLGHLKGEKNIVFVGFPLPVADRSGAPMRAAALIF